MKLAREAYWWWEDSHINCQDWLVLWELRTRYAPHLESPQFSDLIVECKKILADIVKILKSKALNVVEDLETELKIDDKAEPGPEVVAELVPLQEEISFRFTEVEQLPNETLVNLLAEPTLEVYHICQL